MEKKKPTLKEEILDYVKTIVITAAVTLLFLQFVQISRVVGSSMMPNFHSGNIVLVNKVFYHLDDCQYEDVIVAKADFGAGEEEIIKRVIGLPGDTLECKDNVVYRNGKKLNETYINEQMDDFDWKVKVPDGALFVMGDNRNNSADSRDIGPVDFKTKIVGKVFLKLF